MLEISDLHTFRASAHILHGVSLSVAPGEFIAILGSSGCGKTTLLRTIAGFHKASGGAIRLSGRDVVNTPPEKRGMAMMFQSYALWPHMTVLGNVGYGLRLRGVPRDEIRARVAKVLKMLNLSGLEDRRVTDLSGGQRRFQQALATMELDTPLGKIKLDQNRQAIGPVFVNEVTARPDGSLFNRMVKRADNVTQTLGLTPEQFRALGLPSRDNPDCARLRAGR